jgi:lipopolysaccharide/colanic/teichoic acid biosynthesis glycosyltransferase
MTQELFHLLTVFIACVGAFFLLFLFSNAALRSIFARFDTLRLKGRIDLTEIPRPPASYYAIKRVFDFSFALISIVFLLPLLVLITLLIKIESKGPSIYRVRRIGLSGRPCFAYKFRTLQFADKEKSRDFPLRDDPRITRVGRFLRITALDELPGLINVLNGDMSFVGRSRILDYDRTVNKLSQGEREVLLAVKPGLVSLWAFSSERLKFNSESIYDYDMYYLMNRSFWFDLKIILASVVQTMGSASRF